MTAASDTSKRTGSRLGSLSRWLTPLIATAAVLIAGFLLYRTLSRYSLDQIVASVVAIPPQRFAAAGLFAAASYLCLTGFDWLALRYVGRRLPYRYVALTSFVSLSLGHNIGFAALSSGAIRYRFYSRCGVSAGDVAKIILFCGTTVGLGLSTLGGLALLLRPGLAGEMTGLGPVAVAALGLVWLSLPVAYVVLSMFVRRPLRIRGWVVTFPPVRLALAQCVLGSLNYICVSACLYQVLSGAGDVSYPAVLTAYVIAAVTALISHVPGGLGVIESVVLFLLPEGSFIGALLAFRVVYFLIPLCIGGPLFAISEIAFRRTPAAAKA
jgi:uncharacterized membrane protein YbhN (UPF0104 family)